MNAMRTDVTSDGSPVGCRAAGACNRASQRALNGPAPLALSASWWQVADLLAAAPRGAACFFSRTRVVVSMPAENPDAEVQAFLQAVAEELAAQRADDDQFFASDDADAIAEELAVTSACVASARLWGGPATALSALADYRRRRKAGDTRPCNFAVLRAWSRVRTRRRRYREARIAYSDACSAREVPQMHLASAWKSWNVAHAAFEVYKTGPQASIYPEDSPLGNLLGDIYEKIEALTELDDAAAEALSEAESLLRITRGDLEEMKIHLTFALDDESERIFDGELAEREDVTAPR